MEWLKFVPAIDKQAQPRELMSEFVLVATKELAKVLGTKAFFAESAEGGGRYVGRGFSFEPGQRTLVVDDVLTTGGSIRDTIAAVREAGGDPIGVAVVVDRTNGQTAFEALPFFACLSVEVASWEAGECPLCRDGVQLVVT